MNGLLVNRVRFQKFLLLLLTVDTAEELLNLDLARKLHDTVNHGFGTWRTSGHENVNRDYILNTLCYMVALAEWAA